MAVLREIPLVPLNTVLFPGQALPLHIFEERYKRMINSCLEQQQPVGIALIREGEEVGGPAVPHEVGTLANITETDRKEDGEIDIVAVGQERFIIRKIVQQSPYLICQIELFPAVGGDSPRAWALAYRVRELLPDYVKALAKATGTLVQVINIPNTPISLAFLAALALQIRSPERQRLLATEEVAEMLAQELALLRRETAVWRYMAMTQEAEKRREDDQPTLASPN
jgi:hypothetical protein